MKMNYITVYGRTHSKWDKPHNEDSYIRSFRICTAQILPGTLKCCVARDGWAACTWHKWKGNMNMDLTEMWVLTTLGLKTEEISWPLEQLRVLHYVQGASHSALLLWHLTAPPYRFNLFHIYSMCSLDTLWAIYTHTTVGLHCTVYTMLLACAVPYIYTQPLVCTVPYTHTAAGLHCYVYRHYHWSALYRTHNTVGPHCTVHIHTTAGLHFTLYTQCCWSVQYCIYTHTHSRWSAQYHAHTVLLDCTVYIYCHSSALYHTHTAVGLRCTVHIHTTAGLHCTIYTHCCWSALLRI